MRASASTPVFIDVPPNEEGAATTTDGEVTPPRVATGTRTASSISPGKSTKGRARGGTTARGGVSLPALVNTPSPPPRTSLTTASTTYSVRSPSYVGPQNSHQASRPQSTVRPRSHAKAWYTNAEATNALRESIYTPAGACAPFEETTWHRQARIAQLETMARRRTESKRRAVERRELFPSKRYKEERDADALFRASYEAASDEIVFLPPLPAAREAALSSWAYDPIEMPSDELEAVRREIADLKFTSVFEGFAMRRHASSKAAKKMLSKLLPNRGSAASAAAAPPPAVVTEAVRPMSLEPAGLA